MTANVALTSRSLVDPAFQRLAEVRAKAQWFANISNAQTRHAYEADIRSLWQVMVSVRACEKNDLAN